MPKESPKKQKRIPASFFDGELKLPELEEKVLKFWKERRVFEQSVDPKRNRGKKRFVFFEGPPTANGKPGIHHVLARTFKDAWPRFETMRGKYVPRRSGWDTHGLPVEIQVEKELGLRSKKDIEEYGIAAFNKKCRESVWRHQEEFERLTERMGFWLDLKNPYVTYHNSYIESLWSIIAEFAKKKLLYQGHKVVPWCPRCGTSLSSHELAQGYKEVEETSVYMKFQLLPGQKIGSNFRSDGKTYILSWTTTPWTLPGNVALAVGEDIQYKIVRDKKKGENYILALDLIGNVLHSDDLENVIEIRGKGLVGLQYRPLFTVPSLETDRSHRVYPANFVTTTDGTGVVHTAVMYGEDDYQLGRKIGLPEHHTVTEEGVFTEEVKGFAGMPAKAKATEEKIIQELERKGFLFGTEAYKHDYPFCWRCNTPVLYYARDSWFVAMSRLRDNLIAANQKVRWVPGHVKSGRFGEWLKEVKDWNLSRERYWGTPLPIWRCASCKTDEVLGSLAEMEKRAIPFRNTYYVMRHAFPETVMLGVIDSGKGAYRLTPSGKKQAERAGRALKNLGINLIVSSDILRTKETALAVNEQVQTEIKYEPRFREINLGRIQGMPVRVYHDLIPNEADRFKKAPDGGENLTEVRTRVWQAVQDLEKEYRGKKILIISHDYPIWMLSSVAGAWEDTEALRVKSRRPVSFFKTGEFHRLNFRPLPRDESGCLDLHRPYIDQIHLPCLKCHGQMRRVKEVADCWFDSGSMPFASEHYLLATSDKRQATRKPHSTFHIPHSIPYPADFISEAMDQTRGWFYTLLAVATALRLPAPYKNVVCLGLIHDKNGQKMSKSKGNVVDPMEMANKHGMDAVRWYFYTMNDEGDQKNFDEQELVKALRRFHSILYNSFLFWQTYANKDRSKVKSQKSKVGDLHIPHSTFHILDMWILARLRETVNSVTDSMENYQARRATQTIEVLVDDLSRWYIRRSRRRLQRPESKTDYESCSAVLGHVLMTASQLIAPFTPFFAEALYRGVGGREQSVHLDKWPTFVPSSANRYGGQSKASAGRQKLKVKSGNTKLLEQMQEIRDLAAAALAERAKLGIKVRQPLGKLKVKSLKLKVGDEELLQILKDEVNVKEIVFDPKLRTETELDPTITPELRREGVVREFVRMVQELRARAGYRPKDRIILSAILGEPVQSIILGYESQIKKDAGAKILEYKRTMKFDAEESTTFDGAPVWLAVRKK